MSLLGAGCKDVDGRDKRGHDTWGACVDLFAAWYQSFGCSNGPRCVYPRAKKVFAGHDDFGE
jgi:hypothetical protein